MHAPITPRSLTRTVWWISGIVTLETSNNILTHSDLCTFILATNTALYPPKPKTTWQGSSSWDGQNANTSGSSKTDGTPWMVKIYCNSKGVLLSHCLVYYWSKIYSDGVTCICFKKVIDKLQVLDTLGTETDKRSSAAQCVAYIACAELPHRLWPDLISRLTNNVINVSSTEMMKQATLEAVGYICQEIVSKCVLIITSFFFFFAPILLFFVHC